MNVLQRKRQPKRYQDMTTDRVGNYYVVFLVFDCCGIGMLL
ncbi:MAG: hypothetical protein PT953_01845 [Prevotella sp.]|nr:hypothetical protein [Prevotella sp.]MDD7691424.1 hypothetical protein [Prevotella sp.]